MEKEPGGAKKQITGTKHQSKTHHVVGYGAKAEIHQVLHQDIDRIL